MNKIADLDMARATGIEAAETLFKNGDEGDMILLMKGRGGRIVKRQYRASDLDGGVTWSIQEQESWRHCRRLDGISFNEMMGLIALNDAQGVTRTLRVVGASITFRFYSCIKWMGMEQWGWLEESR